MIRQFKFQLGSGTAVNILPADVYQKIGRDPNLVYLTSSGSPLVMFNNAELKPLARIKLKTKNPVNNEHHFTEYLVVPKSNKALLGAQSIQQFNPMTVNRKNILSEADQNLDTGTSVHSDVFRGEGKLERPLHLIVDKSVTPVALPVRKLLLAIKGPLMKEIDRLVQRGILKSVITPTDWNLLMVVVLKSNGKIRMCIEPKPSNKALKRNHYPLSVID